MTCSREASRDSPSPFFFQKHRPHFLMLTDSEGMCIQVRPVIPVIYTEILEKKMLVKKPEKGCELQGDHF